MAPTTNNEKKSLYLHWNNNRNAIAELNDKPTNKTGFIMRKIMIMMAITAMVVACGNKKGYDSVDARQFAEFITTEDVQLIDTRSTEEYGEGHIPGAQNINIDSEDFDDRIGTLDKSRPVAVYCRGGRRSKEAAERFVKAGFEVVDLNGGILSWEGEIEK